MLSVVFMIFHYCHECFEELLNLLFSLFFSLLEVEHGSTAGLSVVPEVNYNMLQKYQKIEYLLCHFEIKMHHVSGKS